MKYYKMVVQFSDGLNCLVSFKPINKKSSPLSTFLTQALPYLLITLCLCTWILKLSLSQATLHTNNFFWPKNTFTLLWIEAPLCAGWEQIPLAQFIRSSSHAHQCGSHEGWFTCCWTLVTALFNLLQKRRKKKKLCAGCVEWIDFTMCAYSSTLLSSLVHLFVAN